MCGFKFLDKPYVQISDILKSNDLDTLKQFSLNFCFHKLRLCESNLDSSRNDLVVFSMTPVFPTQTPYYWENKERVKLSELIIFIVYFLQYFILALNSSIVIDFIKI